MTEKEAYDDFNYSRRIARWYKPGDKVKVGPAYRENNNYVADGHEGNYTVVEVMDSGGDCKVTKGDVIDEWDLMINAGRLTPR
jgi:hypothetical protein